ncbi:MAG: LacI family DNA-binding transcriptional regulator [Erysipelotrichales bacterium]|nr:LacI family DNA-binding transcriptional regulator [Erysipelotrichales bacterium]
MVSIKDIAKKCGVSVATVSKALNNQSDVSAATKTKIQKVAAEMGYSVNVAAEIMAAFNEEGGAFKRKEEIHRMAEANKAFSHFRF